MVTNGALKVKKTKGVSAYSSALAEVGRQAEASRAAIAELSKKMPRDRARVSMKEEILLADISKILGIGGEQAKRVASSVPWSLEETKRACMLGWTPERGWPEEVSIKRIASVYT